MFLKDSQDSQKPLIAQRNIHPLVLQSPRPEVCCFGRSDLDRSEDLELMPQSENDK